MMNRVSKSNQGGKVSRSAESTAARQAVVIGSSIAGLLAAHVLGQYFERVTIIDRDRQLETSGFRPGVPQARHPHTLLRRGHLILEQHFPGLTRELLAHGAIAVEADQELAYFREGDWRLPGRHEDTLSIACSRPLLESMIYRRLAAQPGITILPGHEATYLNMDAHRRQVTGLQLHNRHKPAWSSSWLDADLVVDASGRQSPAPEWLSSLGYMPPAELVVNARLAYATRIYRRPAAHAGPWEAMYIQPEAPDQPHGGMIMPMEDGRWHVTLIGMDGHYPPTDEASFLDYARQLPTAALYQAIAEAEPLTKPIGYRRTESRLRSYDGLPSYLEGFLVYGDAVMAINPLYAQGMTAVALGSLALDEALQAHSAELARGNVTGLAATFQKKLANVLTPPWQAAWRQDKRWSNTAVYQTTPAAA
jgi:2-polyprenyl-6-methoxyphenol hydroxylase-like FAD-dependent oxidoreductase